MQNNWILVKYVNLVMGDDNILIICHRYKLTKIIIYELSAEIVTKENETNKEKNHENSNQ